MKRSMAMALSAAVASPLIITSAVIGASPAQAANCDSVYPAGQAYRPGVSPSSVTIKKGSTTFLYYRLTRGGEGCNGQSIRFWGRNTQTRYVPVGYSQTGNSSLGAGFAIRPVTPTRSFRWFVQFRTTNSVSALVTVR